MKVRERMARAVATAMVLAAAGCAQTSIQPVRETVVTNLPRPDLVLVYKFAIDADEVRANQGLFQQAIDAAASTNQDQRSRQVAREVSDRLADELVKRISGLGLSAQRANRNTNVPPNTLVITGHFLDVNEGNRTARLVIGLGAGQSSLDTAVQVLYPGESRYRSLLEFNTHADSGEMPGAAVTMGAGAAAQGGVTAGMAVANAAASGVKVYQSAAGAMAGRTADYAADYLSRFFATEGWIAPDQVQTPLLGG